MSKTLLKNPHSGLKELYMDTGFSTLPYECRNVSHAQYCPYSPLRGFLEARPDAGLRDPGIS
jgi:hypothetical protein